MESVGDLDTNRTHRRQLFRSRWKAIEVPRDPADAVFPDLAIGASPFAGAMC